MHTGNNVMIPVKNINARQNVITVQQRMESVMTFIVIEIVNNAHHAPVIYMELKEFVNIHIN